MRVVVTGANGFAGRWLCRQLAEEGLWVAGWVRHMPSDPLPRVHYRVQDVRDASGCKRSMAEDAPHQVFHLAAVTHLAQADENPITAHDTNVRGTANVMGAVPATATAVYASTCHVYGRPTALPISETHPCQPTGTYGRTKLEGETAALNACAKVVIARSFHHTGAGQGTRFALPDWAEKVARGATVVTGDLSLRRDYTDVRDICRGYRLLGDRGVAHEVYNLCSGDAPTLRDLLEGMGDGAQVQQQDDPARHRTNDVPEFRGDPAKAEALGWSRLVSRERMLKDLVDAAG